MSDPLTFVYILVFTCQFLGGKKKKTNFDRDRYINLERTAILNLLVPWAWSNLVQSLSHVWLFVTPRTAACHTSLSIPTHGIYSNSCSLSQWCHPTISSCVIPFSHLQSFPASGSFPMSQFFASGGKVLDFQLHPQSFPWISRTDFLWDGLVGSPCCPRDSQESSPTPLKSINSLVLSFLYSPILTSIHDSWKNHSFD